MTDNEIMKGLEYCIESPFYEHCRKCPYCEEKGCSAKLMRDALDLINRKDAEIERLKEEYKSLEEAYREQENYEDMIIEGVEVCAHCHEEYAEKIKQAKSEAIKEFAEKVDEILKRYAHLHKYAEKARHSTEEYADGTPMEMVSVWEVLSLKKWEMCDYETMSTLQDNIETIEKARLLSELEKDFMLLKKEMVGDSN